MGEEITNMTFDLRKIISPRARFEAFATKKKSTPEFFSETSSTNSQQSSKPDSHGFTSAFWEEITSDCNNELGDIEVIIPRSTKITPTQAEKVTLAFSEQQQVPRSIATAAISILLQSGGTARGCDGNLSCTISDKIFKLSQVRRVLNDQKLKNCERKLARTLAEPIAMLSLKYKVEGNLSKQIIRLHPEREFSLKDRVYLSDFQADNPECPEILRKFILETFEKRRTKTSTNSQNKIGPKGSRKGKR